MFGELVESRRVRHRRAHGLAFSTAVHVALIAVASWCTAGVGRATTADADRREGHVYYLPAPPADPSPPGAPCQAPDIVPEPPRTPRPFAPLVVDVAPSLPDADLTPPAPEVIEWTMPGSGSGHGEGTGERVPPGASDAPFAFDGVEHAPYPLATSPLPRYPASLEQLQVTGHVVARFIIDTAGRVEPGSLRILSSDHPYFTAAVTAVIPHLRFRAGRTGGRYVRVLVQQDFAFALP